MWNESGYYTSKLHIAYNMQRLRKYLRSWFVDFHCYFIITEQDSNNMMSHIMETDEDLMKIVDESNLELKNSKHIQVTEEMMTYNVEKEYNNKNIQFDYMVTVTG